MIKWIHDQNNFNEIREKYKEYLVLLFWGEELITCRKQLAQINLPIWKIRLKN